MSISKVNVSGTEHQIVGSPRYATCSTAAATAAKVATIADGSSTFSLEKGARICVSFTYANTASAATLNVAGTGAKAICWQGSALVSSQYWQAGAVVDFVYDGNGWSIVGIAKDNSGQSKITANGILKGDGNGGVSAAVKGTDYFTPADVNEIAAEAAKKVDISDKVSKSGDTMTGKLTVPQVETGADNSNFFQCRKFRGEGDANTYYHAIDFGYANNDKVDFHEYGGIWNFFKNTSGKANEGVLCGSITSNGWEGRAKLKSGSTMVTSQLTENSDAIATTAFVHGLVDNVKHYSASNPPPYPVTSVNGQTGAVTLAKGDVGLGNVDNTSDANKPISNATKAALNNKQSKITANGILKGDGAGNITSADETEVELVDLPTDHVSNISLPTASWKGSDPYTQTVTISGSTANTKVDIQPSEEVYDKLVADNVGYLAIKNVDGTLTAVAKGGKPSVDLTVQVTYNNVY